jgi:hypothetical protein
MTIAALGAVEAPVAFGGGAFAFDLGLVADVLSALALLAVVEASDTFAFAPCGRAFALIGQAFALIGFAFPFIGDVFARVGDRVARPERVFAREQLCGQGRRKSAPIRTVPPRTRIGPTRAASPAARRGARGRWPTSRPRSRAPPDFALGWHLGT